MLRAACSAPGAYRPMFLTFRFVVVLQVLLQASLWAMCATGATSPAPADSSAAAIAFLQAKVKSDPDDIIALNALTDRYLARLRESGDDTDLALAEASARRSLEALPAEMNVAGLAGQVRVDYSGHRFERARIGAQRLATLAPGKSYSYLLLGDAAFEFGRYDDAAAAYERARRIEGVTVETESRAARIALIHGRTKQAQQHFGNALRLAQKMTMPSPELIAWCSTQLGQFWFGRGEWREAEAQYQLALISMPESVLALEHLAELRGAQGKYETAVELYQQVLKRSHRPEFRQALGDLYAFMGKPAEAKRWHDEAVRGYDASVASGHVHYFHHLAGFYADSRPDGVKALRWALADLQLRQSVSALDGVAWAQYQVQKFTEAKVNIDKALASGVDDAHVLYHASLIHSLAGDVVGGAALLQRAVKANPRYNTFHVHR